MKNKYFNLMTIVYRFQEKYLSIIKVMIEINITIIKIFN